MNVTTTSGSSSQSSEGLGYSKVHAMQKDDILEPHLALTIDQQPQDRISSPAGHISLPGTPTGARPPGKLSIQKPRSHPGTPKGAHTPRGSPLRSLAGFPTNWKPVEEAAWHGFLVKNLEFGQSNEKFGQLRKEEYRVLDQDGLVFLDFAGGALCSSKQMEDFQTNLKFPSSTPEAVVQEAKAQVLSYFRAQDEYQVFFTSSPAAAVKMAAEAYAFNRRNGAVLCEDNQPYMDELRKIAERKGSRVRSLPLTPGFYSLDKGELVRLCAARRSGLLAYPCQSNLTGVMHSLSSVDRAAEGGWDVLLDASAISVGTRVNLGLYKPLFLVADFEKLLGGPPKVGCLLVRKSQVGRLSPSAFHCLSKEGFSDKTIAALQCIAHSLQRLESIGVEITGRRLLCLQSWLVSHLLDLRHPTGQKLVTFHSSPESPEQGPILCFSFVDFDGSLIPTSLVEKVANIWSISLAEGATVGNSGGVRAIAKGLAKANEMAVRRMFPWPCGGRYEEEWTPPDGLMRVSLGLPTNFSDVFRVLLFATQFLEKDFVQRMSAELSSDAAKAAITKLARTLKNPLGVDQSASRKEGGWMSD